MSYKVGYFQTIHSKDTAFHELEYEAIIPKTCYSLTKFSFISFANLYLIFVTGI